MTRGAEAFTDSQLDTVRLAMEITVRDKFFEGAGVTPRHRRILDQRIAEEPLTARQAQVVGRVAQTLCAGILDDLREWDRQKRYKPYDITIRVAAAIGTLGLSEVTRRFI